MDAELRKKYKNQTNAIKHITTMLGKYKKNQPIIKEDFTNLCEILPYHPTLQIRKEDIQKLMMRIRPPYNNLSLYIQHTNGELINISYRDCIKNLYGKFDTQKDQLYNITSAFRNAIAENTIRFKKANTCRSVDGYVGTCENCHNSSTNVAVDHYHLSFKQLLEEFLQREQLELSTIEIHENDTNEYILKNKDLLDKWEDYHNNRADYRILCSSCNSHFGAYGYRSSSTSSTSSTSAIED
jgi:hypothetical protein